MCAICDGFTLDQVLAQCATVIAREGFVLQGVSDDDRFGWVYTVGLLDSARHPELIMAGAQLDASARLLQQLGSDVLDGARFAIGDTIVLGPDIARVGAVHPIHYRRDMFATWHNLAARGDVRETELDAVQVLAPASWVAGHQKQPVLAQPFAHLGAARPHERRSKSRTRRKH
jgi:hypothetical protein